MTTMMEMLMQAGGGQAIGALASRFGLTPEQAQSVLSGVLPALSTGLKQAAAEPQTIAQVATMMRENDAAPAADDAAAHADAAEMKGQALLDTLFGDARGAVEQEVASRAAASSGVDSGTIMRMLPMIAGVVMALFQRRESEDGALGAVVGALMGGGAASAGGGMLGSLIGAATSMFGGGAAGSAGGGNMDMLTRMFDADGDGSAMDDLLEKFMKR